MLLRDHQLMNYGGNHSWPPDWLWTAGYDTTHPHGEVGILKAVLRSAPPEGCFLVMEHCGAEYVGVLLLDDRAFCRQIFEILIRSIGKTVQEIGDIDLNYML
jgi:hypothetical protein